jgi:hypothetical protein
MILLMVILITVWLQVLLGLTFLKSGFARCVA